MTFDQQSYNAKQAAILRTLAAQVVSPVTAGKRSKKPLTAERKKQWDEIVDNIAPKMSGDMTGMSDWLIAKTWQTDCKFAGIGAGLFGWFLWNWAFPLLLELAKRWIESNPNQESNGDR